jgi:hypothetical protein
LVSPFFLPKVSKGRRVVKKISTINSKRWQRYTCIETCKMTDDKVNYMLTISCPFYIDNKVFMITVNNKPYSCNE